MRLLNKNNQIFFRFTLMTLLAGGLFFYWVINWIIKEELDEKLGIYKEQIVDIIANKEALPSFPPLIEVQTGEFAPAAPVITDTLFVEEDEVFRQLVAVSMIHGQAYQIIVRARLVESEDLFFAVAASVLLLCLLLLLGLYGLNRRYTSKIWKPFQKNLEVLRKFVLSQPEPIQLTESDIDEFEELRNSLQWLTQKIQADYRSLKEFTENASHEIQTPLAMIRSKIEDLIEGNHLSKDQMESIQQIYQVANRLSRLNKNLLLLTKIENRQFEDITTVSFSQLVKDELSWLSELIEARGLEVKQDIAGELEVRMSRTLADILVKNLIENTIKYSKTGDAIVVKIQPGKMSFANPGEQAIKDPEKLFERFHRRGSNKGSLGLGLAIVKNIADVYNFKVGYNFNDGFHEFFLFFPDSSQNLPLILN